MKARTPRARWLADLCPIARAPPFRLAPHTRAGDGRALLSRRTRRTDWAAGGGNGRSGVMGDRKIKPLRPRLLSHTHLHPSDPRPLPRSKEPKRNDDKKPEPSLHKQTNNKES